MVEPVELKLADIGEHAVYLADMSRDADVTAELVDIGDGTEEALKGLDVKGKLVLTNGPPQRAVDNAVAKRGAVGVVTYQTSEGKSPLDYPDQIAWSRIDADAARGDEGHVRLRAPAAQGRHAAPHPPDEGDAGLLRHGQACTPAAASS